MTTRLLEVPDDFYKRKYFELDPHEIGLFLENFVGFIDDSGEVFLEKVDTEKTVKHHSGDCRLWLASGGYIDFFAKYVIMNCDSYYFDIYDWIQSEIPSLYLKYKA